MMKGIVLSILFSFVGSVLFGQSENRRFAVATSLGSGIALDRPSKTPFSWQMKGYYGVASRLFAGVGTGISVYEKTLVPVFGEVKYMLGRPRKFSPYAACEAGYAFALDKKDARGGFYLAPVVGLQYAVGQCVRLTFAIGYELQNLSRVKRHRDGQFDTEFEERLRHRSVAVRAGVVF